MKTKSSSVLLSVGTTGALMMALVASPVASASTEPAGSAPAADASSPVVATQFDPSNPGALNPDDVRDRASLENVSLIEAERRFRVEQAAAALEARSLAAYPETSAGVWISYDPYQVNVAFTKDAVASARAVTADFPFPAEITPVSTKFSLLELEDAASKIARDRAALLRNQAPADLPPAVSATRGNITTSIDLTANRLRVLTPEPARNAQAEFAARYGTSIAVDAGGAQPTGCDQSDCRHALVAGIRATIPGSGFCSTAFTAVRNGQYFALSAGHCTADTQVTARSNGGSTLGNATTVVYSGQVDAERISANNIWSPTSKVWRENGLPSFINNWVSYPNTLVGAYIRKSGVTTRTTSGHITSKTVQPSYVLNGEKFISADFCVDNGDSGGAVWVNESAYGIVSGKFFTGSCNGPQGGPGIFGSIGPAMTALDVNLLGGNVNVRPNANFTYQCQLFSCSFDGRSSDDDDGDVMTYRWDFGDGGTSSASSVTRSYLLPGTYTVRLTVTDNNGATHTTSQSISVIL